MTARRGALVVLILLGVVAATVLFFSINGPRPMPALTGSTVLVLDVPSALDEGQPPPSALSFSLVRPRRVTLWDVVNGLRRAAEDDRVEALVLHLDGVDWGWAKLAEVRDAILDFRRSGKPVYASMAGGGEAEYLLASTAGTIACPPLAVLQLDGLRISALFMRGTFDKLDIHPNFAHVGQYKSAVESYTNTGMSAPARAALEALLDDTYRWLLDSLAVARGIPSDSVARLLDDGPFSAPEAMARGLVDTVLYQAEVDSLATRASGKRHAALSFVRYLERMSRPATGSRIALVVASGTIVPGRSRQSAGSGELLGSETVIKALRQASERAGVKAVILRVDSPGGDAPAADDIWSAVHRCAARKPVIASLSDYAASGGYYIAVAADSIVTQPTTITGSIGVYGGKLNLLGLYRKLGLNVETVARGRHAEMLSPFSDFTPEEAARFESRMRVTYDTFVSRVVAGRGLDSARVDEVGQGRVWSGVSARAVGLVDSYGGIEKALDMARRRAGIGRGESVVIEIYPKDERTLFQRWVAEAFGSDDDDLRLLDRLPPIVRAWLAVAELSRSHVLALLPYSLEIR
jgi:protease-4